MEGRRSALRLRGDPLRGGGTLKFLSPGDSGRVVGLRADGLVRRRLLDLGFVPGTMVRAIRSSPLGDPTAYGVRGSIVALRGEDADRVIVRTAE